MPDGLCKAELAEVDERVSSLRLGRSRGGWCSGRKGGTGWLFHVRKNEWVRWREGLRCGADAWWEGLLGARGCMAGRGACSFLFSRPDPLTWSSSDLPRVISEHFTSSSYSSPIRPAGTQSRQSRHGSPPREAWGRGLGVAYGAQKSSWGASPAVLRLWGRLKASLFQTRHGMLLSWCQVFTSSSRA